MEIFITGVVKLIALCIVGSWALLPFRLFSINNTLKEIKDEIKKGVENVKE